jgi:RNA polymerase II subunit A small phosphatase-like protein
MYLLNKFIYILKFYKPLYSTLNYNILKNIKINSFKLTKNKYNLMSMKNSYNSSAYTFKDTVSSSVKKNQYSSRLLNPSSNNSSNKYNKNKENNYIRGVSADVNKLHSNSGNNFIPSAHNNPKDIKLSNLIYQQVDGTSPYRQMSSSPYNNNSNRDRVNSPRQDLRSSQNYSNISPCNKIVSQNLNVSLKNPIRYLPENRSLKKTLILDLDETLVHSAFKPFYEKSDILLNVELDRRSHIIHVLKRPGVEEFLEKMAKLFEVVIFTASLSAYANPLIDQLDINRSVSHRLFREHCTSVNGMFIKDMKKLGRDLKDVIIVDVKLILIF